MALSATSLPARWWSKPCSAVRGLGYEVFHAILRADFPVVQTVVAFVSITYILLTLLSDLINARLDPRIALS